MNIFCCFGMLIKLVVNVRSAIGRPLGIKKTLAYFWCVCFDHFTSLEYSDRDGEQGGEKKGHNLV